MPIRLEVDSVFLTDLADVARAAGLTVVEVPGWKTRTTADGNPQIDVQTITCHHTAGPKTGADPSLDVVINGRGGEAPLPGPLAHFLLARDGVVHVVAAGHCNHAGPSLETRFENGHAVGIEAEATGVPGTAGDWPAVQMDAYHRLCAALIVHYKLQVEDVRGHKETCSPVGRKTDPDLDMPTFRAAVAAVQNGVPEMEWDTQVKLTATDAQYIGGGAKAGDLRTVSTMIRYPVGVLRLEQETTAKFAAVTAASASLATSLATIQTQFQALAATVTKMSASLNALAASGGLTAAQAQAAAEAGAAEVLERIASAVETPPIAPVKAYWGEQATHGLSTGKLGVTATNPDE